MMQPLPNTQSILAKKEQRKKTFLRIKIYFYSFIILLLLIGFVYLIVYSSIFQIKKTKIEGTSSISQDLILAIVNPLMSKSWLTAFLGTNNILIWPSETIKIKGTLISEANISKNWITRTVKIVVKEREKFAIWCINSTGPIDQDILSDNATSTIPNDIESDDQPGKYCYWIDKEGIVFNEAPIAEGSLVPVIFEVKKTSLLFNEKVADERFVGNLINLINGLENVNLSIDQITFDKDLMELKVTTFNGPYILFSIRFDPASPISVLKTIKEGDKFKSAKYIDLRIENKIFIGN